MAARRCGPPCLQSKSSAILAFNNSGHWMLGVGALGDSNCKPRWVGQARGIYVDRPTTILLTEPVLREEVLAGRILGGHLVVADDPGHPALPRDLLEVVHHSPFNSIAKNSATEHERQDAHFRCAAGGHGDAGDPHLAKPVCGLPQQYHVIG